MSTEEHGRRKRLTMGEALELALSRGGGDHSSVTLTRNAKGETQIEVVVRAATGGELATPAAAADEARRIYDELAAAYPSSSSSSSAAGGTGAAGS